MLPVQISPAISSEFPHISYSICSIEDLIKTWLICLLIMSIQSYDTKLFKISP